jgi:hypothetical protein
MYEKAVAPVHKIGQFLESIRDIGLASLGSADIFNVSDFCERLGRRRVLMYKREQYC